MINFYALFIAQAAVWGELCDSEVDFIPHDGNNSFEGLRNEIYGAVARACVDIKEIKEEHEVDMYGDCKGYYKPITLKTMKDKRPLHPNFLRNNFEHEAKLLKELYAVAPKIVPEFYRCGNNKKGMPFIAMEFIDEDLFTFLENKKKPIELKERLDMYDKLLEIVKVLHSENIKHCDIKPINIGVLKKGEAFKFLNFEIDIRKGPCNMGSERYRAPEFGKKKKYFMITQKAMYFLLERCFGRLKLCYPTMWLIGIKHQKDLKMKLNMLLKVQETES